MHRPLGQMASILYTLSVADKCVLVWPVRPAGTTSVCLSSGADDRPQWRSFFDLTSLTVVPHVPLCPEASSKLLGVHDTDIGIISSHTAPTELLKHQSENGWAGATEQAMTEAHRVLDLPLPQDSELALGPEEALATSLARYFIPKLTADACKDLLRKRITHEQATQFDLDDDINTEAYLDVAERNDRNELQKWQKAKANQSARQLKSLKASDKRVTNNVGLVKTKPSPTAAALLAKSLKLNTALGGERWWASIKGDPAMVEKWKLERAALNVDNPCGRFVIGYPGRGKRSISWTERGNLAASKECLQLLWSWHKSLTGKDMPDDLATTLAQH